VLPSIFPAISFASCFDFVNFTPLRDLYGKTAALYLAAERAGGKATFLATVAL
jgi:hypothetical protein